jgi:DNA-binding transcriptional LysR family regulator
LLIDKTARIIDQTDGPVMNVHHLELFYYVAKHRGISQAVRKMPYGIQQPAISAQLSQLEEELGTRLFHRRPFDLTVAGRRLFEFIEPFFGQLVEVEAEVRGDTSQRLRLAGSATILRDHFPEPLEEHRRRFPALKLTLREANQAQAEEMLQNQEIDLAITELEGKTPPGIKSSVIIKLPLVLLVLKSSRLTSVTQILSEGSPRSPLISLPSNETIFRLFQQGLKRLGTDWAIGLEVTSLDLIATYVVRGFGTGLSISTPQMKIPAKIRSLPLLNFPPLVLGALWQGTLPAIAQTFLEEVRTRADLRHAFLPP